MWRALAGYDPALSRQVGTPSAHGERGGAVKAGEAPDGS